MNVHCDIPNFNCFIRSEFLYDMNKEYEGQFERCTVYAVSSYKNHFLTFKIMLLNGALFDYIPAHALTIYKNQTELLSLEELTYKKVCPDFNIAINKHKFLENVENTFCYIPTKDSWLKISEYICSVDWYKENQNCHIMILENGQIIFVPNHKILFRLDYCNNIQLPKYKKLHIEWK